MPRLSLRPSGYSQCVVAFGLCASVLAEVSYAQGDEDISERLKALDQVQTALTGRVTELERSLADVQQVVTTPRVDPDPPVPTESVDVSALPFKGASDARVGIIEYSDFQCPYCGAFAHQTLPALEERYIARGLVRFAFSHLPLGQLHPNARNAAETAECARVQGKFWEMHDALFSDQNHLGQLDLIATARRLGLDVPAFGECVKGAGAVRVQRELDGALGLRINVTPTFVIGTIEPDGRLKAVSVVVGVRDLGAFAERIEPLLGTSRTPAGDR